MSVWCGAVGHVRPVGQVRQNWCAAHANKALSAQKKEGGHIIANISLFFLKSACIFPENAVYFLKNIFFRVKNVISPLNI